MQNSFFTDELPGSTQASYAVDKYHYTFNRRRQGHYTVFRQEFIGESPRVLDRPEEGQLYQKGDTWQVLDRYDNPLSPVSASWQDALLAWY